MSHKPTPKFLAGVLAVAAVAACGAGTADALSSHSSSGTTTGTTISTTSTQLGAPNFGKPRTPITEAQVQTLITCMAAKGVPDTSGQAQTGTQTTQTGTQTTQFGSAGGTGGPPQGLSLIHI